MEEITSDKNKTIFSVEIQIGCHVLTRKMRRKGTASHLYEFSFCGFNQLWMKNIQEKKNSRKVQK